MASYEISLCTQYMFIKYADFKHFKKKKLFFRYDPFLLYIKSETLQPLSYAYVIISMIFRILTK